MELLTQTGMQIALSARRPVVLGAILGGLLASTCLVWSAAALTNDAPLFAFTLFHFGSGPILALFLWTPIFIIREAATKKWAALAISGSLYLALGLAYMLFRLLVLDTFTSMVTPLVWPSFLIDDLGCRFVGWECVGD